MGAAILGVSALFSEVRAHSVGMSILYQVSGYQWVGRGIHDTVVVNVSAHDCDCER